MNPSPYVKSKFGITNGFRRRLICTKFKQLSHAFILNFRFPVHLYAPNSIQIVFIFFSSIHSSTITAAYPEACHWLIMQLKRFPFASKWEEGRTHLGCCNKIQTLANWWHQSKLGFHKSVTSGNKFVVQSKLSTNYRYLVMRSGQTLLMKYHKVPQTGHLGSGRRNGPSCCASAWCTGISFIVCHNRLRVGQDPAFRMVSTGAICHVMHSQDG